MGLYFYTPEIKWTVFQSNLLSFFIKVIILKHESNTLAWFINTLNPMNGTHNEVLQTRAGYSRQGTEKVS